MSSKLKRDRIERLIAICIKTNMTPLKNSFAGYIFRLCSAHFMTVKRTNRGYVDTLINAWSLDRWKTLVKTNDYLKKEEKEKWLSQH